MSSMVDHHLLIVLSMLVPLCLGTLHNATKPVEPESSLSGVKVADVWVRGYSRPHPELCPLLGARLRLLIMVASAPHHKAARNAVRLTWGHYGLRSDVALAFMVGAAPALESRLAVEDARYGDLIRSRTIDTYPNLTLKTLAMLDWTRTYCPRVSFLLKTDDDTFINVPKLLELLSAPQQANATRTIWGFVLRDVVPIHWFGEKYFVLESEFSGNVYPDYTMGIAYLLTADCVPPLVEAAPGEVYMRLEDVFVTGVLAEKVGITREHDIKFYSFKKTVHPCTIQNMYSIHGVRYYEQFDFWRKLFDGTTRCNLKIKGDKTFAQKYFNNTVHSDP